ncbi:MAG: hypothetical protein BWY65_01878 [Firmicutes bacterium ADurb.Bin373]|nr:hypothetical protein [Bacillota bacterium]OQA07448.1 MAG: hypothetical protein BWY65_01878 [Firmicutes bacterium ADurb.Bin373]
MAGWYGRINERDLEIFSIERAKSVQLPIKYMNGDNEDKWLDNDEIHRMTDPELRLYFAGFCLTDINEIKKGYPTLYYT